MSNTSGLVDEAKSALQSRTVWSSVISAVAWGLALAGKGGLIDVSATTDAIMAFVGAAGNLGAIIYRIIATKPITGIVKPS